MGMHVVLWGDAKNGFVCVGPFATRDEAMWYLWSDPIGEKGWVVQLDAPALEEVAS